LPAKAERAVAAGAARAVRAGADRSADMATRLGAAGRAAAAAHAARGNTTAGGRQRVTFFAELARASDVR
jgi:hypothetical protein